MFNRKSPEVLIVGAGPVGLFAALALTKRGIHVQVVDEEWGPGGHSYALALHPSSHVLMRRVGLLEEVTHRAYRVSKIALYEGTERRRVLDLAEADTSFPYVSVVRQDVLEDILIRALDDAGVAVQWDHEVSLVLPTVSEVEVRVDRLEVESLGYSVAHAEKVVARSRMMAVPFVLGCDGHRSDVRRSLGIDFNDLGLAKQFAVFEFESDVDLQGEMRIVFHEGTTNVVWPMPNGFVRWSFEVPEDVLVRPRTKDRYVRDHGVERYPTLTLERLQELLALRAPWFDGSIMELTWRKLVRFERRLAGSFGRGRVWLAGDAAHITGPVGVQSMNGGLQEAAALADILHAIMHESAPVLSLDRYGTARMKEWRFLLGLDDLTYDHDVESWIADRTPALVECLPLSAPGIESILEPLGISRSVSAAAEP